MSSIKYPNDEKAIDFINVNLRRLVFIQKEEIDVLI